MWRVKFKVVSMVIGALGAVTPKVGKQLHQIPGTITEVSVQKKCGSRNSAESSNSQASGKEHEVEEDIHTHTTLQSRR